MKIDIYHFYSKPNPLLYAGNQLGEEGTELVRALMDAVGKGDQLGSLR